MRISGFSRCALSICLALASFAGCGRSQEPIGAPGAMPQTSAITTRATRGGSWMLPEAKGEDLIYVSGYVYNANVYVYEYRSGKLVGTLTGFSTAQGLCVDGSGDIFVTELYGQDVVEYAHAATKPKARLKDTGFAPNGCDVDPTTGDLAVANYCGKSVSDCTGSNSGDLVVYPKAHGTPKSYRSATLTTFSFCSYDSVGNLYADGTQPNVSGYHLVTLRRGSKELRNILLSPSISNSISGGLQWDGSHLVIGNGSGLLYQLSIHGTKGTKAGSTSLQNADFYQFWISQNKILSTAFTYRKAWVELFDYPAGGKYSRRFHGYRAYGITVSRAV